MDEILAMILFSVLVLGGPVGCGIKALLGREQRKNLPKQFSDELKQGARQNSKQNKTAAPDAAPQ